MNISENSFSLPGITYPLCSSFLPTMLEGQLCYKLTLNETSGQGKENELMLLLDYNEDRSMQTSSLAKEDNMMFPKTKMHLGTAAGTLQGMAAKLHIHTLSPYMGFGGGRYKMTVVKRMKAKADFLGMALKDRNCEVELYESCRTRKLIEKCGCVPWEIPHTQVMWVNSLIMTNYLQDDNVCSPTSRDCIEGSIGQDFNCSVSCEGIYADVQWLGVSDQEEKVEDQWTMLNGKMEKDEEELNKQKILALVNEYNAFKKRNIRHFRFNAGATEQSYSESSQKIDQLA